MERLPLILITNMATNNYVKDETRYVLGKDIDGTLTYFNEAQEIIFSIILEIDRVCRKNNVPYALAFGSALGLYNYQGFIPWDDDADLAIDYFDIEKLKEAFDKDLSSEYEYICYEKDPRYNILIPTFKVKKKVGYLQDCNHRTLPDRTKSYEGFFVDIVAFVGMNNAKEHKRMLRKSVNRMIRYFISDFFFNHDPLKLKAKMKKEEKDKALLYKDEPYVCQSPVIPFQKQAINLYPREVIFPFKEYEFNGHKLYSFNDVEAFCRLRYGEKGLKQFNGEEYVDLFPAKKRKTWHIKKFHIPKKDENA